MSELFSEVALRFAKLVVATLVGAVVYGVLVGILGVPASVQVALESWIVGALIILLVETSAF